MKQASANGKKRTKANEDVNDVNEDAKDIGEEENARVKEI